MGGSVGAKVVWVPWAPAEGSTGGSADRQGVPPCRTSPFSHALGRFWCHLGFSCQEPAGTHDPWKPKGTRAGSSTVATGGPPNEVASMITRSLASRVAS